MFLELRNNLNRFIESLLNLIYVKKCIVCSCAKTDDLMCKTCAKAVHYLSGFPHKIFNEIPVYSVALYQDTVKTLIHNLKFKHGKNASIVLAQMLFDYFCKIKDPNKEYIVCFVPSYFTKSATRGYNHMLLIAKEFSKLANIELSKNLISKIKYTKPQYKAKNRQKNIKDSFGINNNELLSVKNKTVILLDDITTSGATLEEILNCFIKKDVKNIICLTVAKAG